MSQGRLVTKYEIKNVQRLSQCNHNTAQCPTLSNVRFYMNMKNAIKIQKKISLIGVKDII